MALLDFVWDYPGEPTPERYHKEGKTNLDLMEQEWQWHQLGHMQICTLTQTHNHASIQMHHHGKFRQNSSICCSYCNFSIFQDGGHLLSWI